jgi:hypothetical protein
MPYKSQITPGNPTLLVFLLDRSGSMQQPFERLDPGVSKDPKLTKAQGLAQAINDTLENLTMQCADPETGATLRLYDIAILGYGGSQEKSVTPALGGALAGRTIVSIEDIYNYPLRRTPTSRPARFGTNIVTDSISEWIEPLAEGNTPMFEALAQAKDLVQNWIAQHPKAYPPIIINISDGQPTDVAPPQTIESITSEIMQLSTSDGNVLLFNALLSSLPNAPIYYPDLEDRLPSSDAKLLFRISSIIPPPMRELAMKIHSNLNLTEKSRGMVFQASFKDLYQFLQTGTSTPIFHAD